MPQKQRSIWIGLVFLVLGLTVGLPAARLAHFAFVPAQRDAKDSSIILLHRGESPNDIVKLLTSNRVISDPKSFVWLGRITRQWKNIKAGEYQVAANMTPIEIFSTLTSGISVPHPLTVIEGQNMYEIASSLAANGMANREQFLALCQNVAFIKALGLQDENIVSLEGYIFPDTYYFNKTMSTEDMVRQMVKHFLSHWGPAETKRAKELNMTRHQIITLASIIEKETGAPQERPLIGSIFHNRLRRGMKLQSDPTTIYGMWARYRGQIHKADLFEKNLYNTYAISALPVGPISNPGKEAIQAALHPAESPYLFFVSHNDGTHQFSETLDEHNRAVRKYQLDPAARAGKSWRDLNKKPPVPSN